MVADAASPETVPISVITGSETWGVPGSSFLHPDKPIRNRAENTRRWKGRATGFILAVFSYLLNMRKDGMFRK
jgi:hypothetical protein